VSNVTPAEYLELERQAEYKSEYYGGEMLAVARVGARHALIVANLAGELRQQLKTTPCRVYLSQLRLRVTGAGFYTYPDVLVICGEAAVADDHDDTVLNPSLIIEVLSEATQDYDRGRKFEHYRKLPTLIDYLTVAQDRPHIEQWTRQENGWLLTEYDDLSQTIQLTSVAALLSLSEVYAKVDFDH